MITLNLTEEQASYLQAALDKAMDNEVDSEYYGQYSTISQLLETAQNG